MDITGKKIIIFGLSDYQLFLEEVLPEGVKIAYYIDNDKNKQGCKYRGKEIHPVDYISKENFSEILVLIVSKKHYDSMGQQLVGLGLIEHIHFTSGHAIALDYLVKNKNLSTLLANRTSQLYGVDFDMEQDFLPILGKVITYTMTGPYRMYGMYKIMEYIVKNHIEGDIVECGVWKGGSCMTAACSLMSFNDISRKIYLYDTFDQGFDKEEQHENDTFVGGFNDPSNYHLGELTPVGGVYRYPTEEEVKNNLISTNYPADKIITVKGKVQETIPKIIPEKIAVLRLDTDFYESTYHELNHLYERLSKNGVLIIDDYGHCKGSMMATNQYFQENNINIMLTKIDTNSRMGIKI